MNNGTRSQSGVLWLIAAGVGVGGATGIGSVSQLSNLSASMEETTRIAEQRGRLEAQIIANREKIHSIDVALNSYMPSQGVLELHRAQQVLIERLVGWAETTVTKEDLRLMLKAESRPRTQGGKK